MTESAHMVNRVAAPPLYSAPHLTRLSLTDFRSHKALQFDFGFMPVALSGENGTGKTNILEAISLLGPGRGLRGAALSELACKDGAGGWAVAAHIQTYDAPIADKAEHNTDGIMQIGVGMDAGADTRRLRINHANVKGFSQLAAQLPQLWLTPAMDRLFVDRAAGRRRFFDRFTQALIADHSKNGSKYEKAMRERNRLLQDDMNTQTAWLDGLEDIMARTGVAIAEARLRALDVLADGLAANHGTEAHVTFPQAAIALDGVLEVDLRNRPALEVETAFRTELATARATDGRAGRTLSGPHRSDFIVHHADKHMPAAACSTGEQKTLLIGLILAQARILAQETGIAPILLLDEIAAHLDARRRRALFEAIFALGSQAWMTGTEARIFAEFAPYMINLQLVNGQIMPLDVA